MGTLHGMISLTSGLCSLGAFEFDNTRVPVVMVVTVVKCKLFGKKLNKLHLQITLV